MTRTIMKKLLLTLLLILPFGAQAAPWCLQLEGQIICKFYSVDQCYKTQATEGGSCIRNAQEAGVVGEGSYCLVTDTMRRCVYFSARRCIKAAQNFEPNTAGCVQNTEKFLALKKTKRGKGELSLSEMLSKDEYGMGQEAQ